MAPNYSIYAIPAYWFLAVLPHAYAVETARKANNGIWNNVSPRSIDFAQQLQKNLPKDVFKRFERSEAAHKNMLEGAPLLIGAILAGNMAGLGPDFMNAAAASYLGLRVAYIFAYIGTTSVKYSFVRSLIFVASSGLLFWIYIKAGNKLLE